MNPIVFAIPVFLLTIMIEAWLARRKGKAVYDIPDTMTSLHLGVLSQVTGVLLSLVSFGIYKAVYERFHAVELPVNSVWVWAGALLAYDFCYYWLHRMGHEVNVLWAAHLVHHSSEYYNLSTALRQTSSGWIMGWMFYFPLAVAGVPPTVLLGVGLIDLLYQYWVHTELIGKLGWFDRVFVSPSNHRVHHGQNDYCIDRNYGGILIVWDRMFGTFVDERDDEAIKYGVRKQLASYNPLWGNAHYYADLWRDTLAAPGWRAKLGVWIAPPGGWTDEPIAHFEPDNFVRFTRNTPGSVRWYAALQFAVLVPLVSHFIAVAGRMNTADALVYAVFIGATTLLVGGLIEGSRLARRGEQVRAVAFGIAFYNMSDWFGFEAPAALRLTVLVLMLASAVWLFFAPVAPPAPAPESAAA